jgi:predicted AAA+ superfamily ATPase
VCLNLERDALARSEIDACREFSEFAEFMADRYGFHGRSAGVLFIDEAQESLRLGGFVRYMKEEWERATVILSGSTLRRIFRGDTRYPVGRVRRMVLFPFSFSEFAVGMDRPGLAQVVRNADPIEISAGRHDRLLELYDAFLETGGLPEVVLARGRGDDWRHLRARIVADYEQDFLRLFGEGRLSVVQSCLRSVANFVGGASKNTTVVPNPSTAVNEQINEVFARLEAWHLILKSNQRGPSPEGAHNYRPKRYLFDTGVLRHLRESAVPAISTLGNASPAVRSLLGGVVENQTAIDIARHGLEVSGWKRSSSGNEIDFVVPSDTGEAVPVECKASLTINRRHLRGLSGYLDLYAQGKGTLVSLAPYVEIPSGDGRRIVNVPVYLLERLPALIGMRRG